MSQKETILLLGSNLGDPKKNIEQAISLLKTRVGEVIKQTDFVFSEPVEFVSKNIFCNIAVCINTNQSPIQLLKSVKEIEKEMGRVQDSAFYGEYKDRIIDIDIVQLEGLIFECDRLQIPHKKHLEQRQFSKEILDNLKKIK